MKDALLALDQGTTSTRAILHDAGLVPRATAQVPLTQHYPSPGWVEHEPEEIWQASLAVLRDALTRGGAAARDVAGIGITNQRETVVLWDRATGRALHRAIVWQDRRTAEACAKLAEEGAAATVTARTGLLCDPYFSATKLAWMLENIAGARQAAERGELAFGTVDSFLLWRLTGGRVHATDATNACRTMLYDIRRGDWDEEMLRLFPHPARPAAGDPRLRQRIRRGRARAAGRRHPDPRHRPATSMRPMLGQACFAPGMLKATYGTGCFALLNTGDTPVNSGKRLLTTLAWQLGGVRSYALEGAIFVAGAAVQWLRDGLHLSPTPPRAGRWRSAPIPRSASPSCRPSSASARRTGTPSTRRHPRPDARHRPGRDRPRGAGERGLPDPRPGGGDGGRLGRGRWRGEGCCAWMAAWPPPTGRCSSWPTCSARRSTGRRCGRRRRWVPPTSPGCRPGCCRRPGRPWRIGGWSAASRRPCPGRRRTGRYATWKDAVRRVLTR
jgi:hypothetical protein